MTISDHSRYKIKGVKTECYSGQIESQIEWGGNTAFCLYKNESAKTLMHSPAQQPACKDLGRNGQGATNHDQGHLHSGC